MTCRPRDIDKATRLVLRTLEIIEYFRAPFWIENPGGAVLLHKQEFIKFWEFCRTQVAYCLFSMPYRKLTSCWVACPVPINGQMVWEKVEFDSRGKCPHKRHEKSAQHNQREKRNSQKELFVIPRELIAEIVNKAVPAIAA